MVPIFILAFLSGNMADTPANCTFEDTVGTWMFYESERSQTNQIDCSRGSAVVQKVHVDLKYPNVAADQWGNRGTWTMVYNQGFEVTVSGRSYFAFFDYSKQGEVVTSFCNRTQPSHGWSHDVTIRNWACFTGRKVEKQTKEPKMHLTWETLMTHTGSLPYIQSEDMVSEINRLQSDWVATTYQQWEGLTRSSIWKMQGGKQSRLHSKIRAQARMEQREGSFLPLSWDWRNVSGVNYVSQVRNQGSCGSCYAFSSMGMLESRVRIATENNKKYTFSPQDIVSCSELSQGCDGGFPYLVAGRYAKDFGVVEESCNPYNGTNGQCNTKPCLRHYTANYGYVGGYYGGCSEEAIKQALVTGGPLSVSFEVYDDFMLYKTGVYFHTGVSSPMGPGSFQPLEITNHAVLLVGYGSEPVSGVDFWIVKNSWGEGWGEGGYFRIRRGVDECAIESIAVEATVIP